MRVCIRCGRNRGEQFYAGKRGRICRSCRNRARSVAAHRRRILVTYGISSAEYEAMEAQQDGRCAVCGEKRGYRLNVDHDHKVEKEEGVRTSVRGLLCRRCNKLLRDCRDSIPLLRKLIKYLQAPPAKEVIT